MPQANQNVIEIIGDLEIDPNKKTILFAISMNSKKYQSSGTEWYTLSKVLKNKMNVILYSSNTNGSYIKVNKDALSERLLRKRDDDDHFEKNKVIIDDHFNEIMKDMPKIDYLFIELERSSFLGSIPKTLHEWDGGGEDFFEYLGDDKDTIQKINEEKAYNVTHEECWASPYAFTQTAKYYNRKFITKIIEKNKPKSYMAVVDPGQAPWIYDAKGLYFEDDHRGQRALHKFPLGEMQHFVYDDDFLTDPLDSWESSEPSNTKNLMFYGAMFLGSTKGSREEMYYKYLDKYIDKDSVYYAPMNMTRGDIKNDRGKLKDIDKIKDQREAFHTSMTTHISYKGSLLTHEIPAVLQDYKYTLVLPPVTKCDSINYRVYAAIANNTLPLISEEYDEPRLQIPEHIRKKIEVSDHCTLKERIDYYNTNPKERDLVLEELKDLYNYHRWRKEPLILIEETLKNIGIV